MASQWNHEEWIRSVLENGADLTREQLERTRQLMNAHVRDCLVPTALGLGGKRPLIAAVRHREIETG